MISRVLVWMIDTSLPLFALFFLLLMIGASEVGYRLGRWRMARRPMVEQEISSVGAITTGMIGLLAFTLGLTISFAQSRFEVRRTQVMEEANTIGTAWLQARLVGGEEGIAIASLIEEYTTVRLAYTRAKAFKDEPELLASTGRLQNRIWQTLQPRARRDPTPVMATLIKSLNDMFDAASTQRFAFESRVPASIAWILIDGALLTVGAVGYHLALSGYRQVLLMLLLLAMWTGGIALIADLNRPRAGAIRVDATPLLWQIQSFQSPPSLQ